MKEMAAHQVYSYYGQGMATALFKQIQNKGGNLAPSDGLL